MVLSDEVSAGITKERVSAYLDELGQQCIKLRERSLSPEKFKDFISEMLEAGVPKDRIKEVLLLHEIPVVDSESLKNSPLALSEEEIKTIGDNAYRFVKAQPEDEEFLFGAPYEPLDLMIYRDDLDPEVGKHFEAHGIAKGTLNKQLKTLVVLLTTGIDPSRAFHSMALRLSDEDERMLTSAMGAAHPYTDGGFIILGHPDLDIRSNGFGGVLVNDHFYDAIPRLQAAFPEIRFIRADQMQEKLSQWLQESGI